MSSLFKPTYNASTLSVDKVGTDGLQQMAKAFSDINDERLKRDASAKEQARWDITNARAEEAAQQRRDLLAKKASKEAFLKSYDPKSAGLGALIDNRMLRTFSDDYASKQVKAIQDKYGMVNGASPSSLQGYTQKEGVDPASQYGNYLSDLNELGKKLQTSLTSGIMRPTQESAYSRVYNDVLKQTGNPTVAASTAKSKSEGLITESQLLAQEATATKNLNEARKADMEAARYTRKDLLGQYKALKSSLKSSGGKSYKGKGREDINAIINKNTPATWWPDWDRNTAMSAVDDAVGKDLNGKPITTSEVAKALGESYTLGKWDDTWTFKDGKGLEAIVDKQRKNPNAASSSVNTLIASLNKKELRDRATTYKQARAKTLQELYADNAKGAYEAGFGDIPVAAVPKVASKPLENNNVSISSKKTGSSQGGSNTVGNKHSSSQSIPVNETAKYQLQQQLNSFNNLPVNTPTNEKGTPSSKLAPSTTSTVNSSPLRYPDRPFDARTNPHVGNSKDGKLLSKFLDYDTALGKDILNYSTATGKGILSLGKEALQPFVSAEGQGSRITKPKTTLAPTKAPEFYRKAADTAHQSKQRVTEFMDKHVRPEAKESMYNFTLPTNSVDLGNVSDVKAIDSNINKLKAILESRFGSKDMEFNGKRVNVREVLNELIKQKSKVLKLKSLSPMY